MSRNWKPHTYPALHQWFHLWLLSHQTHHFIPHIQSNDANLIGGFGLVRVSPWTFGKSLLFLTIYLPNNGLVELPSKSISWTYLTWTSWIWSINQNALHGIARRRCTYKVGFEGIAQVTRPTRLPTICHWFHYRFCHLISSSGNLASSTHFWELPKKDGRKLVAVQVYWKKQIVHPTTKKLEEYDLQ
jgi:hypothetical protein